MSCIFPRTMPCCVHYTGRCTQSLFSGTHVRVNIRDCLGIITGLKADRTSSGLQTLSSLPLNSHTYVRTYVGVQTIFVGYCQNTSWERAVGCSARVWSAKSSGNPWAWKTFLRRPSFICTCVARGHVSSHLSNCLSFSWYGFSAHKCQQYLWTLSHLYCTSKMVPI